MDSEEKKIILKKLGEKIAQLKKENDNRELLKQVFEVYKKAGQIEFVTFHQSYGYEEFVEGIKAKTTDKGIEYQIEDGIFKKLSKQANKNIEQAKENAVVKKDFNTLQTIQTEECFRIYHCQLIFF
jgi:5-methylcytosine-specific restriction endonuclease McrBC GTP-binding regulatory subunit McrB